ncbi:MAG: hypothetical protein AAGI01_04345 [Myxococcota bacterium]
MTSDRTRQGRFGELRSLVASTPSEEAWRDICALIEEWSAREIAEVVAPYLAERLGSWPSHLRRTPASWLERVFAGEEVPELGLCRALVLSGRRPLTPQSVQRLFASGMCHVVEHVEVFGRVLKPGVLQVLCEYAEVAALVSLSSRRSEVMKRELSWFVSHATTATLERLTMHLEYFDQQAMSALCEPGALPSLVELGVADNRLSVESLEMLWRAPVSASLLALDVSANRALTGDAAWFMGEGAMPALEVLDVSMLQLRGGVRHLAQCEAPKLRALLVSSNALGANDLGALVMAEWMEHIEVLDVSSNPVGVKGVVHLLRSPAMSGLRELNLSECALDDQAAFVLAASDALGSIERLRLGGNGFSRHGVRAILEAPWFEPSRVELPRG